MTTYRIILFTIIMGVALLLVSCSDNGPTSPSNEAPIAILSASPTDVEVGQTVQLDGTDSSDPDGDDLSYSWSFTVPDGSTTTLSDASVADPVFVADMQGSFSITLTVSDGQAEDSDEIEITASPCPTQIIESNINADRTLSKICAVPRHADYIVSGFIDITDAVVTIEAGVRIEFEEDAALRVNDGAALNAQGTGADQIIMVGTQEEAGFWRGILFRADDLESELNRVSISDGGREPFGGAQVASNITVDSDARLRLTNSVSIRSGGYGLYVEPRGALPGFQNNSIDSRSDAHILIPGSLMGTIDSNTDLLTGDQEPRAVHVYEAGGINEEMTISNLVFAGYRLQGFFNINAPVTIENGVEMEFEEDAALRVNDGGSLIAEGTAEEPIRMIGAEQTPGFWRGILFRADNLTSELNHVEIAESGSEAFAGVGMEPANIVVDVDASLTLSNSIIRDSNGWGVWLNSDERVEFIEEGNTYHNNATGAVGVRD